MRAAFCLVTLASTFALLASGCAASATPDDEASALGQSAIAACAPTAAAEPLRLQRRYVAKSVRDSQADFNARGDTGGAWRSVKKVTLLSYSKCATPSLDEVEHAVEATVDGESLRGRTELDRDALESRSLLRGTADGGLLETLDAWAKGDDAEAIEREDELLCHNCTNHAVRLIIHYPSAHRIAVVDGESGYDS